MQKNTQNYVGNAACKTQKPRHYRKRQEQSIGQQLVWTTIEELVICESDTATTKRQLAKYEFA